MGKSTVNGHFINSKVLVYQRVAPVLIHSCLGFSLKETMGFSNGNHPFLWFQNMLENLSSKGRDCYLDVMGLSVPIVLA